MNTDDLAVFLRKLKINGITKTAVAKRLGISAGYLSDMINGRKPITKQFEMSLFEVFSDIEDTKGEKIKRNIEKLSPEELSEKATLIVHERWLAKVLSDVYKIPIEQALKQLADDTKIELNALLAIS